MSELEPLPPDLRSLFDDERAAYSENTTARTRVHRRLEAAILLGAEAGAGAAVGAAAAGASTTTAKAGALSTLTLEGAKYAKLWIALSLAAGIAIGETHARHAAEPSPAPSAPVSVVAQPPSTSNIASSSAASQEETPAIAVTSLPSAPSAVAATPRASADHGREREPTPTDLAAEQAAIDTARAALARGRGSDALRAAEDHERRFPRGRLAEEREMLAIQALLLLGNENEAKARAERFHKTWPQSLYGGAVDSLLRARKDASP